MWFSLEVIRRHMPLRLQEEIREATWTPASNKPTRAHPYNSPKTTFMVSIQALFAATWLTYQVTCKFRPLTTHLSTECRTEQFPPLSPNTQISIVVLFSSSFCVFQVEVFQKGILIITLYMYFNWYVPICFNIWITRKSAQVLLNCCDVYCFFLLPKRAIFGQSIHECIAMHEKAKRNSCLK